MFETVLFPIDQSREPLETAGKALELARMHSSRVLLLSVFQPEQPKMHDQEAVASLLTCAKQRFQQSGVVCESIEREGKPALAICDVVDELNVDVIVMGTRGVNLEAESGSTASRVIQLAPCPVLVVP